ncbi:MAG: protein kinase [Deltaproteobacteria bacterium]|nr:protein kinase [Deltaproteobacteria bacterium]
MVANSNIGRVLENKYELIRLIGQGGMGEVYEANHRLINRRLAIKLLHADYAREDDVVFRFQREAKASAAIGHDHIVEITDMGVTDTGELFIVMEHLEGKDLEGILESEGALKPIRACHIMIQVLSALEAAHAKGIVHRDLKPGNILLTTRAGTVDYVKLVDFGISKVRASEDGMTKGLTRTGELLGTPSYMSPEQALGLADIGAATDIFSAGVILYEMVTGVLPFKDVSLAKLLVKIVEEDPVSPISLRPGLPPQLVQAIQRAIEKVRDARFADAVSFRRVLTPFSPDTAELTGLATTRLSQRVADIQREFSRNTHRNSLANTIDIVASTPLDTVSPTRPKERDRGHFTIGIIGGAAVLVVLTLIIMLKLVGSEEAPSPAVPLVPSLPASSTSPASDQQHGASKEPNTKSDNTPTRTIDLRATIQPQDAVISMDGKNIGRGSIDITLPADNKEHEIVIQSQGFREHREKMSFTSDISLVVTLEPEESKPSKRRSRRRARKQQQSEVAGDTPKQPKNTITEEPTATNSPKGDRIIDEKAPWED